MLRQLSIKNFVLVDSLALEFTSGFNVLTGETGAGKSLIVDALHFLLGDRIQADMLRSGEERAVVEALFQVPPPSPALSKLTEWGIGAKGGEVLVKREYSLSSGKTRSFVNGEMATAAMISELGDWLVDLHGQHEHQAIFNVGRHRRLVDSFGDLAKLLDRTASAHQEISDLLLERTRLGGDSREIARRVDLLKFQVQEIEASGLEGVVEEDLQRRFQAMRHGEKIARCLSEAAQLLDEEGRGGASGLFGTALSRLQDAAKLDPALEKLQGSGALLQEGLAQFSIDLSKALEDSAFSEEEFGELSERLDHLNGLKKKYGESVPGILGYLSSIQDELKGLEGRDERLKALEGGIDKAGEHYRSASAQLSAKRLVAGKELAKQVQASLKELGLPNAHLDVQVTPQEDEGSPVLEKGKGMHLSPLGWDKVEFLFSANQGEPLRPLAKTASGGEASRVMLALKTVLAGSDEVPTLIFDEIDTGVGARTAPAVASLLERLSGDKQVICISHLAPIAGLGENHLQVSKGTQKGRTHVAVTRLSGEARIEELAKMLGGEPLSQTSLSHARELYARMRRSK
jgi:DNA repair protein RecN (Recombination protein N)